MHAIKEGTVCVVKAGRRSGNHIEVVKMVDSNFVIGKTDKGKERKFAISHLDPLSKKQ